MNQQTLVKYARIIVVWLVFLVWLFVVYQAITNPEQFDSVGNFNF